MAKVEHYGEKLKDQEKAAEGLLSEKSDVITRMKNFARQPIPSPKLGMDQVSLESPSCPLTWVSGSFTRSQAWNELQKEGLVKENQVLSQQKHGKRKALDKAVCHLQSISWNDEAGMYPDVIKALETAFYTKSSICVVNTSKEGNFHADISIADFNDERTIYSLRYFIELKLPGSNLISSENCGQVLDYCHQVRSKQPYRNAFVAILSNVKSAWVFTVEYQRSSLVVTKAAASLIDAIIYADSLSQTQRRNILPTLKKPLSPYSVLAVTRKYFVLKINQPKRRADRFDLGQLSGTRGMKAWEDPKRHLGDEFVLKIVNGESDVKNELAILREIRELECRHIPELVWDPDGEIKGFGIVPAGVPISFHQPAEISRRIVEGLIDGLQYLHDKGIVHRDIRPANLVLKPETEQVVIIDYECAVKPSDNQTDYLGGFICWPDRLLRNNTKMYIPEPSDDLMACILVVLHLLFPVQFDSFQAHSIKVTNPGESRTRETSQIIGLWDWIKKSKIWGSFMDAAENMEYEKLKEMSDVFCYV